MVVKTAWRKNEKTRLKLLCINNTVSSSYPLDLMSKAAAEMSHACLHS